VPALALAAVLLAMDLPTVCCTLKNAEADASANEDGSGSVGGEARGSDERGTMDVEEARMLPPSLPPLGVELGLGLRLSPATARGGGRGMDGGKGGGVTVLLGVVEMVL